MTEKLHQLEELIREMHNAEPDIVEYFCRDHYKELLTEIIGRNVWGKKDG